MVSDLQADNNRAFRLFEKFSSESKAVVISGVSLSVSIIFAVMAVIAMYDSTQANATAETWQTMYKETERECRLAQLEIDDFKIIMAREGFDVHDGESP